MKPLLRKIFFCDAPIQGKFFGLTLLVILPRLLMTIGYVFALPAFLIGKTQSTLNIFSWVCLAVQIVLAMLFALILLGRALPKQRFDKPVVIALGISALTMLGFWWLAPRAFERLWWICSIVLTIFVIACQWYPTVKVRDWLLAVVPLLLGGTALYCTEIVNAQAYLMTLPYQKLSVSVDYPAWVMWWLTVGGIVLLVLAYLLFGRIVAMIGNVPFRSLFGRGVGMLWLLFFASYATSASLALSVMRDYHSSRKELDDFWKMPVSAQAIEELYRKSGCVDQNFWKEFIDCKVRFPALDSLFGSGAPVGYHDAILPSGIYEQWRKAFEESPELQQCERMLDRTLPLPERKYGFAGDETFKDVVSKCREMVRLELWRVRFALEAKDIHAAQQALKRIDRITDFLQQDYSLAIGLTWLSIEKLRPWALARILGSGLADEQWLLSQDAWLQEKESRIPDAHRRMILSEAVSMLEVIDIPLERRSRARFLTIPEAWLFLGREGTALAKGHCVSDFADFPEKPAGIFAGMQAAALRQMGTRKIPELVATLRISRGMIAAELARLRTGHYPETLDSLPMDPFSGKPLRYTVGKTMVAEWHCMPNEDDAPLTMTPDSQKQLGWTDEWCAIMSRPDKGKYTFKTEWRNVAAVQIWSVGPDCVDGGGVRLPKKFGGKANDDLRFMIRLDTEHP